MSKIKRLVLDILIPHKANIIDLSKDLTKLNGVIGANLMVSEVDQQTTNVKATIEGENVDYKEIKKSVEKWGGAVHSIDNVVAGHSLVDNVKTMQD